MDDLSTHDRDEPFHDLIVGAVLSSYAAIYFAARRWMGVVLLVGTLCWPRVGLIGLAGLLIALGAALLLSFDRVLVRSGAYLFNSLLISLAVGHAYSLGHMSPGVLCVLLPITSVLTLFITVALTSLMSQTLGLPSMSLPFVISQMLLPLLLPAAYAAGPAPGGGIWTLGSISAAEYVLIYLRSFGGLLFLPYAPFGVLTFLVLLVHSRLSILYATLGLVTGMVVLSLLPLEISLLGAEQLAFNFMFCGIALGGVFFIPSRGTLALVVIGAALCAALASAMATVFGPLGFAPTALPFNVSVLLVLYVMKLRTSASRVHVTPFIPLSPEENFCKFHLGRARFPDVGFPAIHCPFLGERVVTQGVDGRLTHRRQWKYALDFEVLDEPAQRHSGAGRLLENYYTFNTPVLCPDDGIIVKTIDHVEDRPIGANNFADNWGNLVIVRLDSGPFAKLCHLRQRSLTVREGDRVRRGQIVGYCGNSGRSPVPHLHLQLQTSPQIGAATIPFRIRHYFERDEQGLFYRTAGIPAENKRVEGATVERRVAQCFDNISRREFSYRLTCRGQEVREKITCSIDELGNYVFESSSGDRLTALVHDYGYFSLDYRGRRGLLFWFWLGLSRVPFISNPEAQWHDTFDSRVMLRPWAKLVFDLAGPFGYYPFIKATGTLSEPTTGAYACRSEACVDTTFECDVPALFVAPRSMPRRIRTYVAQAGWVVAAIVELEDPLFIEQI